MTGLVLGGLGRLVVPGRQSIGLWATAASGVAASLLGGVVAHVAHLGGVLQFVVAVLVAAALVMLFAATQRERRNSAAVPTRHEHTSSAQPKGPLRT